MTTIILVNIDFLWNAKVPPTIWVVNMLSLLAFAVFRCRDKAP